MALPFTRQTAKDVLAGATASGIASAITGEPVVFVGSSGGEDPQPSPFAPPGGHEWPAGPAGFLQSHPLRFPTTVSTVDKRTGQPVILTGPAVNVVYNPLSGKGMPFQEFIEKYPQYVVPKYRAPAPERRTAGTHERSDREVKPVSFVSTAFGGLKALGEGLLDFGTDVLDLGLGVVGSTAPVWAPAVAQRITGGAPRAAPTPAAPVARPVSYGGAAPMPYVPATAMPGGAPTYLPGVQTAGLGLPFIDVAPQGTVGNIVPRQTMSMRLPSRVDVPMTDSAGNVRFHTFKNMGRPLLYQGDLAACKRVRRVASRAKRARGGR